MSRSVVVVATIVVCAACATHQPPPPDYDSQPLEYVSSNASSSSSSSSPSPSSSSVIGGEAPEIARTAGGGDAVVVLWPRIIPKSDAPELERAAALLQQRMRDVVARALPGHAIDVRPAPERVCPQGGCTGVNVGIVLAHSGTNGCAAVAVVSPPGRSPGQLYEWSGRVTFKSPVVPFRDPPESLLSIGDFASCATLASDAQKAEAIVGAAVARAVGQPAP